MRSNEENPKRNRLTLNKQIAAAPTHAKKWQIALHGGLPPTEIQRLPPEATGLRFTTHPKEWQAKAKEQLKQRFADQLFPALIKNDPAPFFELLEAMAKERREITYAVNGLVLYGKRPKPPEKKEAGRRLRLAILNLDPDDLISMKAVADALAKWHVMYSDESHLRRVMRELEVHLLKPGERVYFSFSGFGDQPKKWLRKLIVEKNGTATNHGMTRKEYDALGGLKSHLLLPPLSASPDKEARRLFLLSKTP